MMTAMLFYEPAERDRELLPHDPFKALVAPRPIGWVSTVSAGGAVNLAPYSFFNAVGDRPPMLLFSSGGMKDSASFAGEAGEFVWNLPTWELREQMNATSATLPRGASEFEHAGLEWELREQMNATSATLPRGASEFEHAGLEMAPSRLVAPPRVAASPCALECKVVHRAELFDVAGESAGHHIVVGQVVGVHLDERYIDGGRIDITAIRPIARCGYTSDYTVVESLFAMERPD
jgi:flavin reductase (DIM6/NTAB) family NADH-FMN oxidoreductase RutF